MEKITEDYCSYGVAKLLKENRFDIPCKYAWHGGIKEPDFHRHSINFNGGDYKDLRTKWYSAPTHQMAMKWLREVHKLHIEISVDINDKHCFYASIYYNGEECWEEKEYYPNGVATYEEAVEAALKYCLTELISAYDTTRRIR